MWEKSNTPGCRVGSQSDLLAGDFKQVACSMGVMPNAWRCPGNNVIIAYGIIKLQVQEEFTPKLGAI